MTTYDHSVNASEVLRDALLLVGGVGADEPIEGESLTDGLRALNNMIKAWQNQGFHMWTRQEVVVFGVKSQAEYSLGPASTDDEWASLDDFVYTTVNGAVSSGATTLVVDSVTGMALGDRIGVELDDGTRQWTTIDNIVTLTITLPVALTDDVSDGVSIFTYTARPQRPLRLIHARRGLYDGEDIPMTLEAQEEYFDQPNKTTTGTSVFAAYKQTRTSGTLYAWQTVNSVRQVMKFTMERPLADLDTSSGVPDFPSEWYEALVYNLAVRMEFQFRQLDQARRMELRGLAHEMLEDALAFDSDVGSLYIQPNFAR